MVKKKPAEPVKIGSAGIKELQCYCIIPVSNNIGLMMLTG